VAWGHGDTEAQSLAVDIAGAESDDDRSILIGVDRLSQGNRNIVDCHNLNIDHRDIAVLRPVKYPVRETVGAVIIVYRGVGKRAVGVEGKGQSTLWAADKDRRGAR